MVFNLADRQLLALYSLVKCATQHHQPPKRRSKTHRHANLYGTRLFLFVEVPVLLSPVQLLQKRGIGTYIGSFNLLFVIYIYSVANLHSSRVNPRGHFAQVNTVIPAGTSILSDRHGQPDDEAAALWGPLNFHSVL